MEMYIENWKIASKCYMYAELIFLQQQKTVRCNYKSKFPTRIRICKISFKYEQYFIM